MEDVGMTDKQFNGFLRLVISNLESIKDTKVVEDKDRKLEKIINDLKKTLED